MLLLWKFALYMDAHAQALDAVVLEYWTQHMEAKHAHLLSEAFSPA